MKKLLLRSSIYSLLVLFIAACASTSGEETTPTVGDTTLTVDEAIATPSTETGLDAQGEPSIIKDEAALNGT
ncbi:MAG: hypothetical protein ACRCYY_08310, partial [Trueperaceae bacterium]